MRISKQAFISKVEKLDRELNPSMASISFRTDGGIVPPDGDYMASYIINVGEDILSNEKLVDQKQ